MINVTAVGPLNTGHLRVFPFGAPLPNASVLNFVPGQDIANSTVFAQCIDCDSDISIFVRTTADLIVDLIGYFEKPTLGYKIGDQGPAGGWVFYVTDDGIHGLEAAPKDQGDGRWGCSATTVAGADGTEVGTGAQNTADLLAMHCDIPTEAANLTDNYSLIGFNDWFLPSKDELNLMYTNIHLNGLGSFSSVRYWSSTEAFLYGAWAQDFSDGVQRGGLDKSNNLRVRAVQAF